jgi:hypothetical protein
MDTEEAKSDAPAEEPEVSDADTIENEPPSSKRPKRQQRTKRSGRPVGRPPKQRESKARNVKDKQTSKPAGRPRRQPARQQPQRSPRRKPKEPIVLLDEDVLDRWAEVKKEKNFSVDTDVARFLLSW